jgi:adenylosuccinate synthase
MLADCGLPPSAMTDCILVARTYPIRVAGNSGPLEEELTWAEISKRTGKKVEERTTVTNKIRRIGRWDSKLFIKAVRLNGPTEVAITFMDYLYPRDTGKVVMDDLSKAAQEFIDFIETLSAPARVRYIGTGPGPDGPVCMIDRGHVA